MDELRAIEICGVDRLDKRQKLFFRHGNDVLTVFFVHPMVDNRLLVEDVSIAIRNGNAAKELGRNFIVGAVMRNDFSHVHAKELGLDARFGGDFGHRTIARRQIERC